MARIIGGIAASHTPTIGFAYDRTKRDDPVWAPIFENFAPLAAWLAEKRPDVLLLDIGLPGLNGYQVCRKLREEGLTSTLIAAVTGYGQDNDRQLTSEAGFDAHLVKPVGLPVVQQLLNRQRANQ